MADQVEALNALAGNVRFFQAAVRMAAFGAILRAVTELQLANGERPLQTLVVNTSSLPEGDRAAAFNMVLQKMPMIERVYQGKLLTPLATSSLYWLPEADRAVSFDGLLQMAVRLPRGDQRQLLEILACRIVLLRAADRLAADEAVRRAKNADQASDTECSLTT